MLANTRWSAALGGGLIVLSLLGTGLGAPAQAADLARGEKVYTLMCQKCHGHEGKGDGPKAAELEKKPANYTDPKFFDKFTDAELQKIVLDGKEPMPAYKEKFRDQDDLTNVLAYIKHFGAKAAK
jgi:mono/diheme cytochrome c family protein